MARNYTRELKEKACELVVKDGIKRSVVAEKLGINKIMLYKWVDIYESEGKEGFVGKGHQKAANAEMRKLQRENERLKAENEILKKAAAYFAKHPAEK